MGSRDRGYGVNSVTARKLIGVLACGVTLTTPGAAYAQFEKPGSGERYVPGEAIVRFERGVAAPERRDARGDAGVGFQESLPLAQTQVVRFDGPVRAAIARLQGQPEVADAQPNYRYHALAPAPNDEHFTQLWGLGPTPGVDVLPAWDRSRGAGQVIAIIDTGVDLTHPDLAPHLWTGPGGIHGADFVDLNTPPDDFNMHGTHVAGTAAAIAGNGTGVAGVAPEAQIMAVRVLDADGEGDSSQIVQGIQFAAANGATVINMSLGGPPEAGDTAMANAISQAEQANVVVVVAAGNGDEDGIGDDNDLFPTTPCTFGNANLVCVAAVTRSGSRSSFSNFGRTTVDLGAPGGNGTGTPSGDIVSAKPAWATLFSEDFEGAFPGAWMPSHTSGVDWGLQVTPSGNAVTDSPTGSTPDGNYLADTSSRLETTSGLDLSGQRGCRLDFLVGTDIKDSADFARIGLVSGGDDFSANFNGDTSGQFDFVDVSLEGSAVADGTNVKPTLRFSSNGTAQDDGAYVDDFHVTCRGQDYTDTSIGGPDAADGGTYTAIAGTSMASPHVAGVAALVRAVDPGAPPSQVAEAIRLGAKPVAGLAGITVSGGVADAVGAMDAALAIPNSAPSPPPPPAPTRPNRPRFGKVSVNRRGVVSVLVRGDAATTGILRLSANITAARVRVVGRKRFRIRSSRRTTVRVLLNRPARRQLKRKRVMRLRMRAVVKNAAGLTNSRTARTRITLPRRR